MSRHPIDAQVAAKHADIPQPSLFDVDPDRAGERKSRPKSERAVGSGKCPECKAEKVGHQRSGDDVVWRLHWRGMRSGAAVPCPMSGEVVA